MKLNNFAAESVYGHLRFDFDMFPELTFLIGLNGCGKTTALRILVALLSANIETLLEIEFSSASVTVTLDSNEVLRVSARRVSAETICLSTSDRPAPYDIQIPAPEPDFRRRAEALSRLELDARMHPVVQRIRELPPPMFLALDRRHIVAERQPDEPLIVDERRGFMTARAAGGTSLGDLNELVRDTVTRLNGKQRLADDALRQAIIVDAFSYTMNTLGQLETPKAETIRALLQKRTSIEKTARNVGLPAQEIQKGLTQFFERFEKLLVEIQKPRKGSHKNPPDVNVIEWYINKPQVDRVSRLLALMEDHERKKSQLFEQVTKFLAVANEFLLPSGKRIDLDARSYLRVIPRSGNSKALTALSSGERQIVVMLAHLSLNERIHRGGIFIVDEPELSLHIAWQENFVEAIRRASPQTQIVLATHSPAIILGRDEMCKDLTQKDTEPGVTL